MFGCLKNLINLGIVVLAVVGFHTLGGFEWCHDMWVKHHQEETKKENAKTPPKKVAVLNGDNFSYIVPLEKIQNV